MKYLAIILFNLASFSSFSQSEEKLAIQQFVKSLDKVENLNNFILYVDYTKMKNNELIENYIDTIYAQREASENTNFKLLYKSKYHLTLFKDNKKTNLVYQSKQVSIKQDIDNFDLTIRDYLNLFCYPHVKKGNQSFLYYINNIVKYKYNKYNSNVVIEYQDSLPQFGYFERIKMEFDSTNYLQCYNFYTIQNLDDTIQLNYKTLHIDTNHFDNNVFNVNVEGYTFNSEKTNTKSTAVQNSEDSIFNFKDLYQNKNKVYGFINNNRYKVILYWNSWCGYCGAALKQLNTLYSQLNEKVEFVLINTNDESSSSIAKEKKLKYIDKHIERYVNLGENLQSNKGQNSFPFYLILDKNNKIIYTQNGFSPNLDSNYILSIIEE